jgi:CHASE1-domain containing sensor protein
MFLPWVVLLISLLASAAAWYMTNHFIMSRGKIEFQRRIDDIKSSLLQRMGNYEQILYGGRGLFAVTKRIGRDQWREYVENIQVQQRYPGILGVGFAERVPANQKVAHENRIRSEGFLKYEIFPSGNRKEYYPVIYLDPFEGRNLRAFGYDMFSEPTRRAAMEHARDTGHYSVSGRVVLIQETDSNPQNGFLMYLPVYRFGSHFDSVEGRRSAIVGFVYSPFRVDDLMNEIVGKVVGMSIEIFDGANLDVNAILYDSNGYIDFNQTKHSPTFSYTTQVDVGDHIWTLHFSTSPSFKALELSLLISFSSAASL